jgi:hypothetical protein
MHPICVLGPSGDVASKRDLTKVEVFGKSGESGELVQYFVRELYNVFSLASHTRSNEQLWGTIKRR